MKTKISVWILAAVFARLKGTCSKFYVTREWMCGGTRYSIVVVFPEYSKNMANTEVPRMLMLVVSLRCEVAINYYSQLDGVPMHIAGQDDSLHGSSPRTFLTEIYAPTFLTTITCVLRTCAEVLVHLMDILSHTSEVPCKEDDEWQNTHAIAGNRLIFPA
ncbi:hypothetical protein C5167_012669 [Papaver somniferum]|uniref:Secreted protein n=1 Tax=Papaver somniferum TaxID=3469 RepID=A0A4Y7J2C5_PAPSO|nr:hypothetical protein C5167_012669 [Papaver somniferum]